MSMTVASYHDQAFFLSLVLFLAILTTTPYVAHGNVIVTVPGITASGLLFCSPTGLPLPVGVSPPLAGANVTLSCSNTRASVLTNRNGFFSITLIPPVNIAVGLNLTVTPLISNCTLTVKLPVLGCRLLPIGGFLRGFLYPVGIRVDPQGVLLNLGVLGYTVVFK